MAIQRQNPANAREENGVGELSAIPGHKSTCTYRIASESLLYIPCSPQVLPSSFFSSIHAVLGILLTRYKNVNSYTYIRDISQFCQVAGLYFFFFLYKFGIHFFATIVSIFLKSNFIIRKY